MHRSTALPLSSTPVQSLKDSGYFGSCERNSLSSDNKYSPIKEFSCKNILKNLDDEHGLLEPSLLSVSTELSTDVKIETEYENLIDSFDSNELGNASTSNTFDRDTSYYDDSREKSSSLSFSPDKLINKDKMSVVSNFQNCININSFQLSSIFPFSSKNNSIRESSRTYFNSIKIDFISELRNRNCFTIISNILSNLSEQELCSASCVSKTWRETLYADKQANLRRKKLLKEKKDFYTGPIKENRLGVKFGHRREHKMVFSNLTNVSAAEPISNFKMFSERFESFVKEGKSENVLAKCPVCSFASKCIFKSCFLCTRCSFYFCKNCLKKWSNSHACSHHQSKLPTVIGSKQSKRNLKRL